MNKSQLPADNGSEQPRQVPVTNLGSKNATDASRVPSLLHQIDRPIASLRGDSRYDYEVVYQAAQSHRPGRSPRVLIPPKRNAGVKLDSPAGKERNRNIRGRARLGERAWHRKSGYSLRSGAETPVSRYKVIFGRAMRARKLAAQRAEARLRCQVLNKMTALGMPDGYMVA